MSIFSRRLVGGLSGFNSCSDSSVGILSSCLWGLERSLLATSRVGVGSLRSLFWCSHLSAWHPFRLFASAWRVRSMGSRVLATHWKGQSRPMRMASRRKGNLGPPQREAGVMHGFRHHHNRPGVSILWRCPRIPIRWPCDALRPWNRCLLRSDPSAAAPHCTPP